MYITEILPIHKSNISDSLSYFSSKEIKTGALVSIPFRNKKINGICVSCSGVLEQKGQIKNLSYNLKKISSVKDEDFFNKEMVDFLDYASFYYATSKSMILKSIIPEIFLTSVQKINKQKKEAKFRVDTLQDSLKERFTIYKSFIREEFAKKNSILLVAPSIKEVLQAHQVLEKGIENKTFFLTSETSEKEAKDIVQKINSTESSFLIITTPHFLSMFCQSVENIILESENSKAYNTFERPFLDMRKIIYFLCKFLGIRLILSDSLLSIESIYQAKEDFFGELSPLKFRYIQECKTSIETLGKQENSKKIEIFSDFCKKIIKSEDRDNLFVYVSRKGLSPYIFCGDCGKNVTCQNCLAPVALYENKKDKEDNFFICNHCKTKRTAIEKCKNCNSWKLIPFGFGLETVKKELEELCKKEIFVIDKDSVKNHKKAEKIMSDFYKKDGAILLATSMAIPYISVKISNTIFTGFDATLSIPDFRISEKIVRDILILQERTQKNLIITTRQPEFKTLEYASKSYISDFYKEEIEERKEFSYPPFTVFIKISISGEKKNIRKKMEETKEYFKPFDLFIFDSNYLNSKKEHTVNGLLTLEKKDWPNKIIFEKIMKLSPEFTVKIDPDNIL